MALRKQQNFIENQCKNSQTLEISLWSKLDEYAPIACTALQIRQVRSVTLEVMSPDLLKEMREKTETELRRAIPPTDYEKSLDMYPKFEPR